MAAPSLAEQASEFALDACGFCLGCSCKMHTSRATTCDDLVDLGEHLRTRDFDPAIVAQEFQDRDLGLGQIGLLTAAGTTAVTQHEQARGLHGPRADSDE